jgi:N-formylmaleamate deformylase
MLFIPGATCSGDEWNETAARYSKTYQCHVFTLAGYAGQAPLSNPPYLETYKNQIIAYINNNHLNHVILVGHSIGGFLSLWIASELKDHLQKVIVVDALPFFAAMRNPDAKNGFNEEQAKGLLAYYSKLDEPQLKAAQIAVAKGLCADSTKWEMIAGWGAKSDRKTMAYSMCEMLGNDIRQNISAIQVPVLVMGAFAANPLYPQFTSAYVQTAYEAQYQQCKTCVVHVTPSAKHFIMYLSQPNKKIKR